MFLKFIGGCCIKDANRCIAWVSRNLLNKDSYILARVYQTIIRPKLEYCLQLWNPVDCHGNWSVILKLESIQWRITVSLMTLDFCPAASGWKNELNNSW